METNSLLDAGTLTHPDHSLWALDAIIDWDPIAQFVVISFVVGALAILWLAVRNGIVLTQKPLTPKMVSSVACGMGISFCILIFLVAVWALSFASAMEFNALTLASLGGKQAGLAQETIMRINAQFPVRFAWMLVVLTGVHATVGIVLSLKKNKLSN